MFIFFIIPFSIALFGPYGSGKGTQGKILAEKYDLQTFDTGSELRFHIKNQTEIGKKIKPIIDRGDLVPNAIVMEVVQDFISRSDKSRGYLFDGIPRFQEQKETFDALIESNSISLLRFFIHIPREISLERQLGRQICQVCGNIYPATYEGNVCEKCNTVMEKRSDSTHEIAKKRINIYETETLPVIEGYKAQGEMMVIDGTQNIEKVTQDLCERVEGK